MSDEPTFDEGVDEIEDVPLDDPAELEPDRGDVGEAPEEEG